MTKITRQTQKIFAGSASNNGVIGSGQDGTKVLTNNIATLQSKGAWDTGWLDMVLGTKKFPPLEEFQALDFINTRQLSYMFQEGMSEYDSGTTYFTNSWVKKAGTNQIWVSLTDTNVGNALTDPTKWAMLVDFSASAPTISGFVTGNGKEHWGSSLESGWIYANFKTIGNASSNATNRANADTAALFTMMWTDYSDALYPIYTSAGILSARGGSAASDFAANKAICVIDKRGRVSAGKDNMGGTAANRLTSATIDGTILGNYGGEETHTLITAELAAHTHGSSGLSVSAHTHSFSASTTSDGAHTHTLGNVIKTSPVNLTVVNSAGGSYGPDGATVTGSNGAHTHTVSGTTGSASPGLTGSTDAEGSGTAHNNVQPTAVCNYIIKL